MSDTSFKDAAAFIRDDLRLKSFPVAVKFLKNNEEFPEKARRSHVALGKKSPFARALPWRETTAGRQGLQKRM